MKRRPSKHAPITEPQTRAMARIAHALTSLLAAEGAEGIVLVVDWGPSMTTAAAVANVDEAERIFPRMVRDVPGVIADWAERMRRGTVAAVGAEQPS